MPAGTNSKRRSSRADLEIGMIDDDGMFRWDEEGAAAAKHPRTHAPASAEGEKGPGRILWSRWDVLPGGGKFRFVVVLVLALFVLVTDFMTPHAPPRTNLCHRRRLLFVGYTNGLVVWDCTEQEGVHELLNLSTAGGQQQDWGVVRYAAVLPSPRRGEEETLGDRRPLIGIVYVFCCSALHSQKC